MSRRYDISVFTTYMDDSGLHGVPKVAGSTDKAQRRCIHKL